jgi:hypothetical protein
MRLAIADVGDAGSLVIAFGGKVFGAVGALFLGLVAVAFDGRLWMEDRYLRVH